MNPLIAKASDYFIEFSLYGLIFVTPFSKAAIEVFAGFMLLGFIVKKIFDPDFSFLRSPAHAFLLLFVIFSAASLLNSGPYFNKGLAALFTKWLKYIGIFLFTQDILIKPYRVKRALAVFLFAAFLIGIDGLSQRFLAVEFLRHRSMVLVSEGVYAITSSFNHYNDFGTYLIITLSVLTALLGSGQLGKWQVRFFYLVIVLQGACLLLTFSRGSWLGFIFSLLIMVLLTKQARKSVPFIFVFLFLILIFFLPGIKERFILIFQPQGDADRLIVWRTAFRMIRENPFLGKGIGTFMDYFSKYMPDLLTQYAHNCYLQIWAETGIFSLLSFLLFIGTILLKGIKIFRKGRNSLVLGLVCGIMGFLVHSFFDTQLYSLQLAVFFWFTLGFLVALIRSESANLKR